MACNKPKCAEARRKEQERLKKIQSEKLNKDQNATNSATASDNNGTTK